MGAAFTVGDGFTFIVSAKVAEEHPFAVAVMVKIVACRILVVFVNVPEMLAPIALAAKPVRLLVLSLTQLNVVPTTLFGLVIFIVVIGTPEQTI